MSRNFEEEYKEYLNAQAPDIWGRIEAGIDALPIQDSAKEEKIIPIGAGQKKRAKKKRKIRYQHYRAIVSAAACLFALLLIIPVYMLTKPSGKDQAPAEAAKDIVLTDATITNTTEETAMEEAAVEESAPEETIETEEGATEEMTDDFSGQEMQSVAETEAEVLSQEPTDDSPAQEPVTQLASGDSSKGSATDGSIAQEAAPEESAMAEEQLNVVILSEEGRQEAGILYTASVVGADPAETVSVIVPDDSQITLEIGAQYTVTLQQFVEEGYRVVLDAVKQ